MIGKIMTGRGFAGTIAYCMDENHRNGKDSKILSASGISVDMDEMGNSTISSREMAKSFHLQAAMNQRVGKPVKHVVLSWKEEDGKDLNDGRMAEIAEEYMKEMGYVDTQYLIIRHSEKNNPHCHIIINAVDSKGKRISDSNEKLRNMKTCRKITDNHGFALGFDRLLGFSEDVSDPKDRCRYYLSQELAYAITMSHSVEEFTKILEDRGIGTRFMKDEEGKAIGISFTAQYDNRRWYFSGTGISRRFSLKNIGSLIRLTDQLPELKQRSDEVIRQLAEIGSDSGIPAEIAQKKKELVKHMHDLEKFRKEIRPRILERVSRDLEEGVYVLAATMLFGQPAILCIAVLVKFVASAVQLIRDKDAREEEMIVRGEYRNYSEAERIIVNRQKNSRKVRR